MAMNRRGQAMLVGVMIAIFVFVFAIICIPALKEVTNLARGTTSLDCTNSSISTGNKMTCLIVDLYLPYFVGALLAGSVAYILVRGSQTV